MIDPKRCRRSYDIENVDMWPNYRESSNVARFVAFCQLCQCIWAGPCHLKNWLLKSQIFSFKNRRLSCPFKGHFNSFSNDVFLSWRHSRVDWRPLPIKILIFKTISSTLKTFSNQIHTFLTLQIGSDDVVQHKTSCLWSLCYLMYRCTWQQKAAQKVIFLTSRWHGPISMTRAEMFLAEFWNSVHVESNLSFDFGAMRGDLFKVNEYPSQSSLSKIVWIIIFWTPPLPIHLKRPC
jgi:hypothetical protein